MNDDPLIITCAVVGAELSREDTPHLPITPAEIADSACRAVEAGASVIHLHVRDEEGKPSQRVDIFEDATWRIRGMCDCIIQYSTGGAVGTPLDQRLGPLSLKPEMASLSMGTMNFGADIFVNDEKTIRGISEGIKSNGILAELEIFDWGMMDTLDRYKKLGWLPERFHVQFVLGAPGGMAGEARNLVHLASRLEAGQTWSVAGIGRSQLPLNIHAMAMGGHVRTGLEDNIYYRKGELAVSNATLVERLARLAKEMDRPLADALMARKILKIVV